MAEGWQSWLFLSTGLLQLLVVYQWRAYPDRGVRAAVIGLFGLNGGSMLLRAGDLLLGVGGIGAVAVALDVLTNVFLLWLACVGLPRRVVAPLVGAAMFAESVVVVHLLVTPVFTGEGPSMDLVTEAPLWVALAAVAMRMTIHASGRLRLEGTPLLILAAIGFRFAELATSSFVPNALAVPPGNWAADPLAIGRVVSGVGFLGAMLLLLTLGRRRRGPWDTRVGGLLAAGALMGAGHAASATPLAAYFTLMFLRPVFFAVILDLERDPLTPFGLSTRTVGRGLGAGMGGLLAVVAADVFWSATPLAAGAVGLGAALLVLLIPEGAHGPPTQNWTATIEQERATLPPDWQERGERGRAAYLRLPPGVRANVDALPRWQRIVLALDGVPAPASGRLPEEGTTAVLHLLTHCPYGQIGSEVARTNRRAGTIARELGIDPRRAIEPIIRSEWGRVDASRSGRVKAYQLSALGQEVCAALRVRIGAPGPGSLREVIGEAYRFDGPIAPQASSQIQR